MFWLLFILLVPLSEEWFIHSDNKFLHTVHRTAKLGKDGYSQQVTINNGSPVVLSFVIEDVVKKLEWVDPKNKVISQVESAKYSLFEGGTHHSLIISNTVPRDSGYYHCTAILQDGTTVSGAYFVRIREHQNELEGYSGSKVTLTVQGENVEKYIWLEQKGSQLVGLKQSFRSIVPRFQDHGTGSLSINMLDRQVILYCVVKFTKAFSGFMKFIVKVKPDVPPFIVTAILTNNVKLSMKLCNSLKRDVSWYRRQPTRWFNIMNDILGGRYAVFKSETSKGSFIGLHIQNVQLHDLGVYKAIVPDQGNKYCSANFRVKLEHRHTVEVHSMKDPTIVTGVLGDAVILSFTASGVEVKDILWSKVPKPLPKDHFHYTMYQTGNTFLLKINHLTLDKAGLYSCTIDAKKGPVIITYFLVTIKQKASTLMKPTNVVANVYGSVTLSIKIPSGVSVIRLKWYAPREAVGVHFRQLPYSKRGPTTIKVRIIAIKVNEGGLYQCMVSLSDGSSNLVRFNIQVDGVRGFITKKINARERQDVKLSVDTAHHIRVKSVTWYRVTKAGTVKITPDRVRYVTGKGGAFNNYLFIRYVFGCDAGTYEAHIEGEQAAHYVVRYKVTVESCGTSLTSDQYVFGRRGLGLKIMAATPDNAGVAWYRPLACSYINSDTMYQPTARSLFIRQMSSELSGRYVVFIVTPKGSLSGVLYNVLCIPLPSVFTFIHDKDGCPDLRVYKLYTGLARGRDAQEVCKQCGGALPTVRCNEDMNILSAIAGERSVMIGLRSPRGTNNVHWINGITSTHHHWRAGQPQYDVNSDQWTVVNGRTHSWHLTTESHCQASFICEMRADSCKNKWPFFNPGVKAPRSGYYG